MGRKEGGIKERENGQGGKGSKEEMNGGMSRKKMF